MYSNGYSYQQSHFQLNSTEIRRLSPIIKQPYIDVCRIYTLNLIIRQFDIMFKFMKLFVFGYHSMISPSKITRYEFMQSSSYKCIGRCSLQLCKHSLPTGIVQFILSLRILTATFTPDVLADCYRIQCAICAGCQLRLTFRVAGHSV